MVINLLSNAVKFTSRGEITVSATRKKLPFGEELRIHVIDTGMGIRADDLPKLFGEFSTLQSHQAVNPNGTGLGLYLCRSFVRLMGGDIRVKSEVGVGSKFTVSLPLPESMAEEAKEESQPRSRHKDSDFAPLIAARSVEVGSLVAGQQSQCSAGNNTIGNLMNNSTSSCAGAKDSGEVTVLVVDDNEMNLYVMASLLVSHHLACDKATNGLRAIDLVQQRSQKNREKPYSLIFMDVNMPVMDGIEAAAVLKGMMRNHELRYTPIVGLSGEELDRMRSLDVAGDFDVLSTLRRYGWCVVEKPMGCEMLRTILDRYATTAGCK